MNKVPLTARGAELLREELKQLKTVDRPRIVEAIATARAHGDLKENAEYHAAKDQQGMAEARIRDIEAKLSNAQIIDVTKLPATGRVVFGSTIQVVEEGEGNQATYRIVGEDEANIKDGLMSVTSPIARALVGKEEGDIVEVQTPGGSRTYEILKVQYI
jgi:transcription elongation factor GreA